MPLHLQQDIDRLKQKLLALSARVEENVYKAVHSITDRDEDLARQVIDSDPDIDQDEVVVEEECLKILALHQPVAHDLRFIVAVLKINHDLERVGDLAVNMAERAVVLCKTGLPDIPMDLVGMAGKAQQMLRESLDALVQLDPEKAREVRKADDDVDDMNRQVYDAVKKALREHPDDTSALIHILSASRHLERIADHATNIAKDVIYLIEGEIVRHKPEQYNP